jgi:predicted dehydrogenase
VDEFKRELLNERTGALGVTAAAERLQAWRTPRPVLGANDRVRLAIVGLRGSGEEHIRRYSELPNVEIAALCDIDDSVMREQLQVVRKMGFQPKTHTDIRKLLEDKSIDAVSINTPNHWHALMAIWACQAGKDVYVEKPCSHNLWEGRQLVRAAVKYNRIVQHGTQYRSNGSTRKAVIDMHDGLLGDLYLSRGLCLKWRDTIGRAPVSAVPAGIDYDLWTGPAPYLPFTRNHFHYNWHWFWDYGNGDIGNEGVHELDIARWGLGVGFPNRISAMGGHFMFDDDQQTPNTLNCVFQYDLPNGKRKMLEFEVRHWISNHEAEIGTRFDTSIRLDETVKGGVGPVEGAYNTIGNIFYGSKGMLALDDFAGGYHSWMGKARQPGPSAPRGTEDHFANFIACVVNRNKEDLRAPIEEGHISSGLAHLANVSYRLGRTLDFDPDTESVRGDDEANHLLRDGDRGYRPPFVIPENV